MQSLPCLLMASLGRAPGVYSFHPLPWEARPLKQTRHRWTNATRDCQPQRLELSARTGRASIAEFHKWSPPRLQGTLNPRRGSRLAPSWNERKPRADTRATDEGAGVTKSPDPLDALRLANQQPPPRRSAPADLVPYNYYQSHPEHRPRKLTRKQLRRRAIRGG